jgi:hypothetical protein
MFSRDNAGVPRGAILVVIVGLLACVAAALLTVDQSSGGEQLSWDLEGTIPDSGPGPLQIRDATINATRPNASGYKLFRIAATAQLDPGSFAGAIPVSCTVEAPPRSLLGRTPGKRASYPLPSTDLESQAVPDLSIVRFNAKGTDLVGVDVSDAIPDFTNANDVKVDWAPYKPGRQTWDWVLRPAKRKEPVTLSFATMWRTTADPGAKIRCSAQVGARKLSAATSGKLGG